MIRGVAVGRMASVWSAEDRWLRRMVAVKALGEAHVSEPAAVSCLEREACVTAHVSDHPTP